MKDSKGLIVFTVDVYSLPPFKAEALTDRMLDKLKKDVPEGWHVVVSPVRHEGNKIQVFSFAGEEPKSIPAINIDSKDLIVIEGDVTREELREYGQAMAGAPVNELSDEVNEYIDNLVEFCFKYELNKKKHFIAEEIMESIKDGEILIVDGKTSIPQ